MVTEDPDNVGKAAQLCPMCRLAPATEHHYVNGTMHTDTYTCLLAHIWQVRWSDRASEGG